MHKGISEGVAMTIQEQLIKLNNKFDQLHQDFSAAEMQQKSLDTKYTGIVNSIRSKWQIEYDKQNQLKEEVLKYYRIAKDNSKKELVHSGIAPQRPDLAKLNSLIEKINVNKCPFRSRAGYFLMSSFPWATAQVFKSYRWIKKIFSSIK